MFRERDPQESLWQSEFLVPPKKARRLERSWAEVFRNEALPLIDEERFAPMYCADNGRPNRAVQTVLGVHLLKEMFNLTDDEALGACPTILEEKPLPGPRESCGNLMRPSWPVGVPVGSAAPVLNRLRPLGPGTCLAYPVGASPARQSFRRLWVRAIRVNSPATLSRPRSRNCRKPRACLISP